MELNQEMLQAARNATINELGTEPPCPWCAKPRVKRSDYIRCNPCGTNWGPGEDISKDPRLSRTRITAPISQGTSTGAPTAKFTSDHGV
jgi:ribosomal protein L37AE/L43A